MFVLFITNRSPPDSPRGGSSAASDVYKCHFPPEAFPPLTRVWATETGGRILVFGNVLSYGPGPRAAVAVALDSVTLAATVLDTLETRPAVQTQAGPRKSDAECLVFQILKRTNDEPPRYAGFNLARGKWDACDP